MTPRKHLLSLPSIPVPEHSRLAPLFFFFRNCDCHVGYKPIGCQPAWCWSTNVVLSVHSSVSFTVCLFCAVTGIAGTAIPVQFHFPELYLPCNFLWEGKEWHKFAKWWQGIAGKVQFGELSPRIFSSWIAFPAIQPAWNCRKCNSSTISGGIAVPLWAEKEWQVCELMTRNCRKSILEIGPRIFSSGIAFTAIQPAWNRRWNCKEMQFKYNFGGIAVPSGLKNNGGSLWIDGKESCCVQIFSPQLGLRTGLGLEC